MAWLPMISTNQTPQPRDPFAGLTVEQRDAIMQKVAAAGFAAFNAAIRRGATMDQAFAAEDAEETIVLNALTYTEPKP